MLQGVSNVLPLTHAVNLARPLLNGTLPVNILADMVVLAAYAMVGYYISLVLFRKRLAQ
jgi:lipooligosaccharide transport system permease protein